VLVALAALQPGSALGQDFVAHGSDQAIFIRWQRANQNQVFNVYRKTSTEDYVKLNQQPIAIMKHRSDIVSVLGGDTSQILENFNVRYPEQIHEVLDRKPGISVLAGTIDPRLAIIRGDGYLDTTVVKGTRYSFKITFSQNATSTEEILYADEINLSAETIPPLPPSNLMAKSANLAILLFMSPSETGSTGETFNHNAGYDIFRSTNRNGVYQKINKKRIFLSKPKDQSHKPIPCFVDKELKIGTRYWYKSAAIGILGTLSETVGPVSAVALDKTPPEAPTIDHISQASEKSIMIVWQISDNSDVTGFNVYRSTTITAIGPKLNPKKQIGPSQRTFKDSNPKVGQLYWYRVTAVDKFGNEAFSPPRKGARYPD
jgi:hypothetical protein